MKPFAPHTVRHGPAPDDLPPVEPSYTLDRDVARARREMGEAKWRELNAEWA